MLNYQSSQRAPATPEAHWNYMAFPVLQNDSSTRGAFDKREDENINNAIVIIISFANKYEFLSS